MSGHKTCKKKPNKTNKQKRTYFDCIAEAEIITYYIGISTEEIKKICP